jgi:hypothetical protein
MKLFRCRMFYEYLQDSLKNSLSNRWGDRSVSILKVLLSQSTDAAIAIASAMTCSKNLRNTNCKITSAEFFEDEQMLSVLEESDRLQSSPDPLWATIDTLTRHL